MIICPVLSTEILYFATNLGASRGENSKSGAQTAVVESSGGAAVGQAIDLLISKKIFLTND